MPLNVEIHAEEMQGDVPKIVLTDPLNPPNGGLIFGNNDPVWEFKCNNQ
jgi:hypothetical protein